MRQIWKSFRALYFASLMMLIGSGLLSTYLALRLAADHVDSLWVGALMAANYFGLVLGGKIGHRLIARVGHIRAYAACAGIVGAAVLGHGLIDWLPAWLFLRVIVGLGMMCQYMVIESWLNEQADAKQRGMVFSGYMIASYLGLVLGQLILVMHPSLGLELLMLVAGVLMKLFGSHMLYAFFSFFALVLVWRIRPKAVTNLHQVDDAPLHHVAMPDSMSSSPLVVCLDPRVDEQIVQEQMHSPPHPEAEPEPEVELEGELTPPEDPDAGREQSFTEARP